MTAILTENSHAKRDSPNYSIVWKRTCNIDPCSIHVHRVLYGTPVGACSLRGVISKLHFNLLKKMLEFKKKNVALFCIAKQFV